MATGTYEFLTKYTRLGQTFTIKDARGIVLGLKRSLIVRELG